MSSWPRGVLWPATSLVLVALLLVGCTHMASRGSSASVEEMAGTRPNIILIMADDLGFSDLGSYGSVRIATPNLDRLAEGGLQFTQFYNAARCVPTRASLLTGLYPRQAGIGDDRGRAGNGGDLSLNAITLAEGLGEAGYASYMTGKWHVTPWNANNPTAPNVLANGPIGRGFDRFYGIITSIRSYYDPPSLMEDLAPLPSPQGDYHFTDAVTENALRYLEEHDDPSQPYFLYMAYSAPHWPMHAREEDIARYRGKFIDGWDVLSDERYERMIELGLVDPDWPRPDRDPQQMPWSDVNPEYRAWFDERMAVYAAMIEQMDRGIGRILDEVEARGELENTIVIFLADNGACAEEIGPQGRGGNVPQLTRDGREIRHGNTPSILPGPEDTYGTYGLEWASFSNTPFRRFKSFTHEGGIATPLIVSWPSKIAPGRVTDVGHVVDFMPTFLELAGVEYPTIFEGNTIQPVEGTSLLPVLAGGTRPNAVYGWEHEGNRAVRQGEWKLVSRWGEEWELFNMTSDRLEANDLSATMPAKVTEMIALYDQWAARTRVVQWAGVQTEIGFPDAAARYGQ